MAAGDSIVSICNRALIALGEDPIVSLQDDTKGAILCGQLYDPVRREVLQNHPWQCATQSANLALTSFVPLTVYDYAYALPADCLRFLNLPDNDLANWEVGQDATLGRLLLTNEPPTLAGTYIRDLTDPTEFEPLLAKSIALALAVELCEPLTQSTAKLNMLSQRLEKTQNDGRLASSDEAASREWDEDIWLRARR